MSTDNMFLWRNKKNYPRIITEYSFLPIPLIHWNYPSEDVPMGPTLYYIYEKNLTKTIIFYWKKIQR